MTYAAYKCDLRMMQPPVWEKAIKNSVRILRPGHNLQNGATLTQMRRYSA